MQNSELAFPELKALHNKFNLCRNPEERKAVVKEFLALMQAWKTTRGLEEAHEALQLALWFKRRTTQLAGLKTIGTVMVKLALASKKAETLKDCLELLTLSPNEDWAEDAVLALQQALAKLELDKPR